MWQSRLGLFSHAKIKELRILEGPSWEEHHAQLDALIAQLHAWSSCFFLLGAFSELGGQSMDSSRRASQGPSIHKHGFELLFCGVAGSFHDKRQTFQRPRQPCAACPDCWRKHDSTQPYWPKVVTNLANRLNDRDHLGFFSCPQRCH